MNMRLNNAVEEALGQGDCAGSINLEACARSICSPLTSSHRHATASGAGHANSALRINHAEDEHYGMRSHS